MHTTDRKLHVRITYRIESLQARAQSSCSTKEATDSASQPSTRFMALCMTRLLVLALALAAASQSLNQFNQVVFVGHNVLKDNRNVDSLQSLHQALFARGICFGTANGRKEGRACPALHIPFQ